MCVEGFVGRRHRHSRRLRLRSCIIAIDCVEWQPCNGTGRCNTRAAFDTLSRRSNVVINKQIDCVLSLSLFHVLCCSDLVSWTVEGATNRPLWRLVGAPNRIISWNIQRMIRYFLFSFFHSFLLLLLFFFPWLFFFLSLLNFNFLVWLVVRSQLIQLRKGRPAKLDDGGHLIENNFLFFSFLLRLLAYSCLHRLPSTPPTTLYIKYNHW